MTIEPQETPPPIETPTRPLYWSVRRELWENRSVFIAPVAVAALFMFGFVISTFGLPARRRATLALAPAAQRAAIGESYDAAAIFLIVTAMIIGIFYCLDALYGERRDRSILFWKSLPVSDRTTVLSKISIPLLVLPAITFVITVVTQFAMLVWSSLILLPSGLAWTTWTRYNLLEQSIILLYGTIALVLWHAPIYGWLMLISAWARRATFLWAVLPLFAISAIENIAFHTHHVASFLGYRFVGHVPLAFTVTPHSRIDSFAQLTPGRFLISPGLWLGLAFAAIVLAAAVRLRRNREPI